MLEPMMIAAFAPERKKSDKGMRRRELKRCHPEWAALAFVTLVASMGKIAAAFRDARPCRISSSTCTLTVCGSPTHG
jgi:hypothetical protein